MATGLEATAAAAPDVPAVRDPRPRSGLVIAIVSAAAFGLSGTLAHAMLSLGWSPVAVVAVRVGGAFVVLAAPCALALRRTGPPSGGQAWRLLGYGVVAVAGAQLCYFSAVQYLSVGVALLLEYLAPVLLIGFFWVRDRRRPAIPVLVGAALALVGLVLVLDLRHGLSLDPVGVAWGLAAAVCLAGYFVLAADDGETPAVSPLLLTTAGTGVGAVVLVLVGLTGILPLRAALGTTRLGDADVPWWLPMALLILVSAVLAYLTGIIAVRRLGSSVASFVALAEVLFAVTFAALLLHQQPTGGQLVGGALILLGIAAVQAGPVLPTRRVAAGFRRPKIRR